MDIITLAADNGASFSSLGWIGWIIIGGIAGWIAEKIMKTDESLLMNIITGIIGGVVGGWILQAILGTTGAGWFITLLTAVVGACILIWIVNAIKRSAAGGPRA
ncbi:GlsB/YeaQ/YmgE family stress response membrane protein [Corynebacterium massiliense]|uniref:GlsB/YeaQ/YmgE family stress response membrane protein n=1 Tax=Corynebacterium massiliense TaxID=441501 RepID=UPI002353B41D|nr:GlsB/YeaQ/YmgE family stress response membrane protein [Corynebacterium massiliense]